MYKIKCLVCSKSYEAKNKYSIYCSMSCSKKAYRERKKGNIKYKLYQKNKKQLDKKYKSYKKECLHCRSTIKKGKLKLSEYKTRKFCSNSCSASYNNKGRRHSDNTIIKIKKSLDKYNSNSNRSEQSKIYFLKCNKCEKLFIYRDRRKKYCKECLPLVRKELHRKRGRLSAQSQNRRSKKEIKLYNLLSKDYACLNNKPIFNGWDADILIPSLKLAILWNGIWHYKELPFNNHSIKQVKTRDKIKLKEIVNFGWNYIIVKDFDPIILPINAYKQIKELIKNKQFNIVIQSKNI